MPMDNYNHMYRVSRCHSLGVPLHMIRNLVAWLQLWDRLTQDLLTDLDVVLAFAGGRCTSLTKTCSHYGGIAFEEHVEPFTSLPYNRYIRWLVNGVRTVDAGNALMGELVRCFLDTTAHRALHAHCCGLGYEKRGDILEAVIGAMHILRGDDVTGQPHPQPWLREVLARRLSLDQCSRAAVTISRMVSVMIVVTDVAWPLGISVRDLLL